MDPISHFAAGVIVGSQCGDNGLFPLFAGMLSLANDGDFVFKWLPGKAFYFFHHRFFHSLTGSLALALGSALAMVLLFPLPFSRALVCALALQAVHLLLDIVLAGGDLALLAPFSSKTWSLPLFAGLHPRIQGAKCEKKSPLVCLLCQAEVFARSYYRWLLVAVAAVLYIRPNTGALLLLLLLPLLLHLACYLRVYRHFSQRFPLARVHPMPADSFCRDWLVLVEQAGGQAVHAVRCRPFAMEHRGSRRLEGASLPSALRQHVTADKDIRSFLHAVPCSRMTARPIDAGYAVALSDPRFAFADGCDYFCYKLIVDSSGKVITKEFREKWTKETHE